MVDQPIAACHARPKKANALRRWAVLSLVWALCAVFSLPGFAASGSTSAEWILSGAALAQEAYLKSSDTAADDFFGDAVAIDGNTLVVGAPTVGNMQPDDAAYVFVRDDSGNWSQQALLRASNAESDRADSFGISVSISGDTIVIGASSEDSGASGVFNAPYGQPADDARANNGQQGAGAAYVFVRDGSGNWSEQAYLKASNAGGSDAFGVSVSVSGDTLVVGASNEDSDATEVDGDQTNDRRESSGAAYVFVRDGAGRWAQQAYLKASNAGRDDNFGRAVSISDDTLIIGAWREDSANGNDPGDNSARNAGAAYVFVRDGTGVWTQQAYLKASNADAFDEFGAAVAVSGDTVVVGATSESSNATGVNGDDSNNELGDSGAAYVFVRTGTSWAQQAYLKASNSDAVSNGKGLEGDQFGFSVAISGGIVAVGAIGEDSAATGLNGDQDDNTVLNSGAAYTFFRNGTTWSQQVYYKASNTGRGDEFGKSVAISGNALAVGAPEEGSNATGVNGDQTNNLANRSGAVYMFSIALATDLVLEKTSGSFFTPPGGTINYEILVVNAGPSDVFGARVTDTPPPVLSNVIWDCMAIDGAMCQDANGVDEIDQTVDIPNGGAVMYTLSGTLPITGNNPLTNTASVSNPLTELNPADNSDSDTDLVGSFADGFESVEP